MYKRQVLADVKQRDYQDTHRAAAPLKQAEDAVLLDTSELDFEQSLDAMKQILSLIHILLSGHLVDAAHDLAARALGDDQLNVLADQSSVCLLYTSRCV